MDTTNKKYIVSPVLDFLLLGGGSLIVIPLIMYIWPQDHLRSHKLYSIFIAISVFFSYAVNFPHFIYSYQIVYTDFFKKLSGAIDKSLQMLYIWTSMILPVALAGLIAFCYFKHDLFLFGFLGNIGLLINGWHYAKQGFGVLIVTSVYQNVYYTAFERRVLIWNANILWVYLWMKLNVGFHERQFWHAHVYTLDFPVWIQQIFFYLACAGALASAAVLVRKYIRDSVRPPLAGLVGYLTALYFWLVILDVDSAYHFHPIIFLIPSMHAIQYITVVLRMKQNEVKHHKITPASMAIFIGTGLVLGFLSFNVVPMMLDKSLHHGLLYQSILFGVIFAVFINIHHYFIDNVIWRKENSRVKHYLYEIH